jgi:hypothetical protein
MISVHCSNSLGVIPRFLNSSATCGRIAAGARDIESKTRKAGFQVEFGGIVSGISAYLPSLQAPSAQAQGTQAVPSASSATQLRPSSAFLNALPEDAAGLGLIRRPCANAQSGFCIRNGNVVKAKDRTCV